VGVFLWVGYKYDVDSVYLGREKAKFLGHVSQADLEATTPDLARGGDVNAWHAPPFILLSPEKPSARGTSSGQAHGIYEEAREIRNGRRQKVFWGYGAHRSLPLLSSDAGHLLRLAASLLGHNLCFVTRNQIKLFVLLTKDFLVRIKSCRKGIEGVVRGKLIPRSLHCLQNFMPVHGLLLDHLSHH